MGKRKNEQPPEGGGGKFHVPKTKRSLGDDSEAPGDDGLDTTGDADGKVTPAMGWTDDRGQTTSGSTGTATPRSANREAAAPGATQLESPQRGNSADEAEAALERHGSAGDAETQTHHGMGNICDGPERPREAAGAATALPGDTGVVVPAEVPGAHRKEEGEHSELGDTNQNQEPPGTCVVNAEESECGAASERAMVGETRENGTKQPRATGMSDAESCGSPEHSGVCALAVDTEGGTAGVESTGETSGEAAAGREETRGEETPSPGTGLTPDPAVAAGGSPVGERDGEAAVVSAAGMDMWPPVCCKGMAEAAPAVMVTLVPTGTTELPGVGTGTAEPPGTAELPGMGTGTTEPPNTTEPPSVGTSTAEPPGVGTGTTEPPNTTEPPSVGTSTAEPPGVGTGTTEPLNTTEPPSVGTSTAEPPGVGTGTTEPLNTTEPPRVGTSTAEPPGVGTGTTEPPNTTEPPSVGTSTAEPPGVGTGTTEPPSMGTGAAVGAETPGESRVARETLPLQSELPLQQPPPATDRHDPVGPAPPGWSHNQEPPHREDATDVICGLILELSNLNRLAMSTHRGLEMLRRPKPRQSRRPVPPRAGRW